MGKNWCFYLLGLIGSVVFHAFYFGWFSWFLLVLTLSLPWFSLLVSLPAMLRVRLRLDTPARCRRGEPAYVTLRAGNGFLPMPRFRFRLVITSVMSGQRVSLKQQTPGDDSWYVLLDTSHCGVLRCSVEKGSVYDYLGLWRLPVRSDATAELMVEPVAAMPQNMPNLSHFLARRRQPKPGGGFSEEHELRDYRPGDSLRDIHWKLSVKTDRLILREAQEPIRGVNLLTLDLAGAPEAVDSILEQLLWLSQWLLEHETEHQVLWIDPADCRMASVSVQTEEDLQKLMVRLLASSVREDLPSLANRKFAYASWRFHILPEQEVEA